MESLDVVAVGLNVVDVLLTLPPTITHNDKHEVSDLVIQGGGPAATAACVPAALGWRVGFVARMGDDTISKIARAEFVNRGVSDACFIDDPDHQPGVAVVEITANSGDRTIFYNLRKYRFLKPSDIPESAVRSARLVMVDSYEIQAALAALRIARKAGCKSVVDVENGDTSQLRELISLGTDVIIPMKTAQKLSGHGDVESILSDLAASTRGTLIVTDGSRGSWALTPKGVLHQPAFPVKVVDTTGCGDVFHGAYGAALLDDLPLPQRMEFASFLASRVAKVIGGRADLPGRRGLAQCDLSALSEPLRHHIQHAGKKVL